MFFTNLLSSSLRKQVDKVSIVLVIPSILFVSAFFGILEYLASRNPKDRDALAWVIICHILTIVTHLFSIVGYLRRIPQFYLPYLIAQGLILITLIVFACIVCIASLHCAIYEAIAAWNVEPFTIINWLALTAYKFVRNKDFDDWILGGIGSFGGLFIGGFLFIVFYDTWQFIKNEKYELERLRLYAVVEAQQRNMATQHPAPILGTQPAAFPVAPSNMES